MSLQKPTPTAPLMQARGFEMHIVNTQLGLCPICSKPIVERDFRDQLSKQEYSISGMCQGCQDMMFTEYEEDWDN